MPNESWVQNIKEGIEGHAVGWYSDVFELLFANLDNKAARNMWKKQLADSSSRKKKADKSEEDEVD